MTTTALAGLSSDEARELARQGLANTPVSGSTRTTARILRTTVFSFYNNTLFVIGAALLALGRYSDAVVSVGLGIVNAALAAIQELRARRTLSRLQLLAREPVTVVRDGVEVPVLPADVVLGDLIHVRAGDQIVVDGPVIARTGSGDRPGLEVDESLLTGESDPIARAEGDRLLSGSSCASGEGLQRAEAVGTASHAGQLTLTVREDTTGLTPLQSRIDLVVRLLILLVVLMSGAILAQALLDGSTVLRFVQTSAVLSGLVPYGLFFLIAVAYAVGAARIAGRGALVQQTNAVEAVSRVDVVCTDKTGTLTSGRLTLAEVSPSPGVDVEDARRLLGTLARSVATTNITTAALAAEESLPGARTALTDEVEFRSALRWSGVTFAEGGDTAVLGALATLRGALSDGVKDVLAAFAEEDVAVKVISGDDPGTVAALALRAGLAGPAIAGPDLALLTGREFDAAVAANGVFGRVAPEQKEQIVDALRRSGRHVAMVGDGVNDARALKRAQVGVAMRSGSSVTRDVADIVLLDDSFATLPSARTEGRRIIAGVGSSMYLFLARVVTQMLVILTVTLLGLGFPYTPTQVGLTLFTVGVPTFFLTLWARPVAPHDDLLASLARFVIPVGVLTAGFGTAVYAVLYQLVYGMLSGPSVAPELAAGWERYTGIPPTDPTFAEAAAALGGQSGLSVFVSTSALVLILLLDPPHRIFTAWTGISPDRRPTWLALGLLVAFAVVLLVPATRAYFGLTAPDPPVVVAAGIAIVAWFVVVSLALRHRALERLLGPGATGDGGVDTFGG